MHVKYVIYITKLVGGILFLFFLVLMLLVQCDSFASPVSASDFFHFKFNVMLIVAFSLIKTDYVLLQC